MHKAKKIINYNLTMNIQNNSSLEAQKDSIFKEAIRDLKRKKINVQIFASKKLNYKTIWSADEDRILLDLIKTGKTKDWKKISTYFKNKSPIQCSARFKRINPINNKGKWTNEEDEHLLKMIGLYGKNWSKITKHFKSRTGKQMRDRYLNVLSPEFIKDKFDEKEDEIIIDMYKKLGTNWAEISKHLPRRTPDMIKNRFYQYLKAKNQLSMLKFFPIFLISFFHYSLLKYLEFFIV